MNLRQKAFDEGGELKITSITEDPTHVRVGINFRKPLLPKNIINMLGCKSINNSKIYFRVNGSNFNKTH